MNKKNLYILILGVIGLLLFPFVLNLILRQDAFFPVVGDSVAWLSFWPTYLSTIASLGMIILTYRSLKQTREQMIRYEQQREEENRALITASIIVHEKAFYLKLKNIGRTNASRVSIVVNHEFIDSLPDQNKFFFEDLKNPFYIEVEHPVYIYIGWCDYVNDKYKDQDMVMRLSGSYHSTFTEYKLDEELRLSEFINKEHFVVRGDLETTMDHIKRRLVVQNDFHHPIQISLENIEQSLRTLVKQNKEHLERVSSKSSEDIVVSDDIDESSDVET